MTTLNFLLTDSELTIVLNARPYTVAVNAEHYEKVLGLVKSGASEDAIQAVFERAAAPKQEVVLELYTYQGGILQNSFGYHADAVNDKDDLSTPVSGMDVFVEDEEPQVFLILEKQTISQEQTFKTWTTGSTPWNAHATEQLAKHEAISLFSTGDHVRVSVTSPEGTEILVLAA